MLASMLYDMICIYLLAQRHGDLVAALRRVLDDEVVERAQTLRYLVHTGRHYLRLTAVVLLIGLLLGLRKRKKER